VSDRRASFLEWAGLAAVCAMCLSRLAGFGLADPDEGRYAEISREMIELHDWVIPHLAYVNYFEKPPLLYWLVGLSFRLFGMSEWAARLVPACAAIGGVVLSYALGVRLLGRRGALLGAAILITSPLYFALSQVLIIDMLLTLCVSAMLAAIYQAHVAREKRRWAVAAAVAAGLGVLAKGPVALALPGLIALAFLRIRRDGLTIRAVLAPWPILVFAAIAVPWFALIARQHTDFPAFFFLRENLYRFATSQVGHPESPYYYVPVVLGGFFPWTLLVVLMGATASGRAAARRMPPDAVLFLSLWAAIVIGIFTLARAKLSPYVLPAFPALALLLGGWLDRALDDPALPRTLIRFARGVAGIAAAILVLRLGVSVLPAFVPAMLHRDCGNPQAFLFGGTMLALAMLPAAALAIRRRDVERVGGFGVLVLLIIGVACGEVAAIGGRSALDTSRNLALAVEEHRAPGDIVVAYDKVMQGLFFYTQSRVVQFDSEGAYGELQFGASSAHDRADFFWTGERRLSQRWRSGRHMFIVTGQECEQSLAASLDPAPEILARDGNRVVLVNFLTASSEAAVGFNGSAVAR
jgi:4-amino-4-deoxy-L-arabinose transferase-like glycosyltransferase